MPATFSGVQILAQRAARSRRRSAERRSRALSAAAVAGGWACSMSQQWRQGIELSWRPGGGSAGLDNPSRVHRHHHLHASAMFWLGAVSVLQENSETCHQSFACSSKHQTTLLWTPCSSCKRGEKAQQSGQGVESSHRTFNEDYSSCPKAKSRICPTANSRTRCGRACHNGRLRQAGIGEVAVGHMYKYSSVVRTH